MPSNRFAPCPQVLRTETDANGNLILHLANGQTHSVPRGFQADCDNGKYHNVSKLTPLPG